MSSPLWEARAPYRSMVKAPVEKYSWSMMLFSSAVGALLLPDKDFSPLENRFLQKPPKLSAEKHGVDVSQDGGSFFQILEEEKFFQHQQKEKVQSPEQIVPAGPVSTIPIFLKVSPSFGGVGTSLCPPGSGNTSTSRSEGTGAPNPGGCSTCLWFGRPPAGRELKRK